MKEKEILSNRGKYLKRFLIFGGVFLVLIMFAILGFILFENGKKDGDITEARNVETSEIIFPVKINVAKKGRLIQWINTSGIARALREVDVIPRISG